MAEYRQWLVEQIARYDRMVDATEFPVDQIAYNEVAHALRRARDEFDRLKKEIDHAN